MSFRAARAASEPGRNRPVADRLPGLFQRGVTRTLADHVGSRGPGQDQQKEADQTPPDEIDAKLGHENAGSTRALQKGGEYCKIIIANRG